MKKHRKLLTVLCVISGVLLLLFAAVAVYVGNYYHADAKAVAAMESEEDISVVALDGAVAFKPESAEVGFIFYPGGKVEHTAYAPLMRECAERGILCVLIEMPYNLAVLDIDAAEGISQQFPEISRWFIGGHSLGGSMAAAYLEKHAEDYAGLVLLGSYSAADLSEAALKVISLYGSEDGVLNGEKYAENEKNLPEGFVEEIISGGCHAGFGEYGAQAGDGKPTITSARQIEITAEILAENLK